VTDVRVRTQAQKYYPDLGKKGLDHSMSDYDNNDPELMKQYRNRMNNDLDEEQIRLDYLNNLQDKLLSKMSKDPEENRLIDQKVHDIGRMKNKLFLDADPEEYYQMKKQIEREILRPKPVNLKSTSDPLTFKSKTGVSWADETESVKTDGIVVEKQLESRLNALTEPFVPLSEPVIEKEAERYDSATGMGDSGTHRVSCSSRSMEKQESVTIDPIVAIFQGPKKR